MRCAGKKCSKRKLCAKYIKNEDLLPDSMIEEGETFFYSLNDYSVLDLWSSFIGGGVRCGDEATDYYKFEEVCNYDKKEAVPSQEDEYEAEFTSMYDMSTWF